MLHPVCIYIYDHNSNSKPKVSFLLLLEFGIDYIEDEHLPSNNSKNVSTKGIRLNESREKMQGEAKKTESAAFWP